MFKNAKLVYIYFYFTVLLKVSSLFQYDLDALLKSQNTLMCILNMVTVARTFQCVLALCSLTNAKTFQTFSVNLEQPGHTNL